MEEVAGRSAIEAWGFVKLTWKLKRNGEMTKGV